MIRDEYFRRLTDEAYIELYLSANDGARMYWPWRMHPPSEANDRYRNACEKYIIDSDPLDENVSNVDVLDEAFRLDAEVASLADVYEDKDGTVDALLEGMEQADDHVFGGDLLLPLQAPYAECYKEIGEPQDHSIGIGGLKDGSPAKRIEAAKEVREIAGPDVWIHGFGWGVSGIAQSIRNNPGLLDSIDYSSPMQGVSYDQSAGKERMSVAAAYAGAKLIEDLREVSSHVGEEHAVGVREDGQTTLL